jgi:hypothetical protein
VWAGNAPALSTRLACRCELRTEALPIQAQVRNLAFSACNYEQETIAFRELGLGTHNRTCVHNRPNSQREGVRTPGYATVRGRTRGASAHVAGAPHYNCIITDNSSQIVSIASSRIAGIIAPVQKNRQRYSFPFRIIWA